LQELGNAASAAVKVTLSMLEDCSVLEKLTGLVVKASATAEQALRVAVTLLETAIGVVPV
jgi:hypothetical protein